MLSEGCGVSLCGVRKRLGGHNWAGVACSFDCWMSHCMMRTLSILSGRGKSTATLVFLVLQSFRETAGDDTRSYGRLQSTRGRNGWCTGFERPLQRQTCGLSDEDGETRGSPSMARVSSADAGCSCIVVPECSFAHRTGVAAQASDGFGADWGAGHTLDPSARSADIWCETAKGCAAWTAAVQQRDLTPPADVRARNVENALKTRSCRHLGEFAVRPVCSIPVML